MKKTMASIPSKDRWQRLLNDTARQLQEKLITRKEAHRILSRGPMDESDIEDWLNSVERFQP